MIDHPHNYRKGHRYLTVVADHDQAGRVVWAGEGKSAATLEAFYDELGETGCAALEAVGERPAATTTKGSSPTTSVHSTGNESRDPPGSNT